MSSISDLLTNETKLRALTLNVWGVPFFTAERKMRIAAIAQHLLELKPDVVAIQEAWLSLDRRTLVEGGKRAGLKHWHYFASGVNGSGLLLLSRYPLVDVAFLRFKLTSRPERVPQELDYFGGKGIGYARIQTPTGFVELFNIHPVAQYTGDSNDLYRAHRAAAAYEAARFVNTHANRKYPVILMGDLNMRPDQLPYRLLRHLANLLDSYSELNPQDPGYTYSVNNPYSNKSEPSKRLDYILYRAGSESSITPVSSALCFNQINTQAPRAYTDHYGVLSEFQLNCTQIVANELPSNPPQLYCELEELLYESLVEARCRKESHLLNMGVALVGWLVFTFWNRRAIIPVRLLTGYYWLVQGWLSLLVVPEEISGLESMLEEVRKQLPPVNSISQFGGTENHPVVPECEDGNHEEYRDK
ncbi:MAG: endonuclease/exonuclease/phosphatase family protein [Chloroflexi bacterium]|uniref:Endonuclease/exonuclease/phosphatase family protein n=1 Tax=Candidatus Chlorohelix allophototropha TaxID=3003348 RepID=A0A8T7M7S6_9CHLR|nr:endonuclease/exonuclease/phosphatase family protein [Chloroflexota bacterium]WJW68132.1 endonuclease/exonuclease/phosphatase family protein [Chloroflexota bacterium L227-S17]